MKEIEGIKEGCRRRRKLEIREDKTKKEKKRRSMTLNI